MDNSGKAMGAGHTESMHALPHELTGSAFTSGAAQRAGLTRARLQRGDIIALGSGVYVPKALVQNASTRRRLQLKGAALLQDWPEAWVSHASAAHLHGLWLPQRLVDDPRIHLSHPDDARAWARRRGVCGHRVSLRTRDIVEIDGVRVSSPARIWLDVAGVCTVRELILMGDQLVRHPYPRFEDRMAPHANAEELQNLIRDARGAPGRRRCLTALKWIRVGADSVQETLLRLALIRAGLPEPALQVPAQPASRWSPCADLGYPASRIAIQYEGDTHFTPQQQRADQRRDNIFIAEGWRVLRFNSEDSREGFERAVAQVRAALGRG